MLFLYLNSPPPPPIYGLLFPHAPPPTATAETDVIPAGAIHEYVPGVVYSCCPQFGVVIELLDALDALVPTALVAVTENVYVVFAVSPVTVIGEVAPVAVIPPGELVTV